MKVRPLSLTRTIALTAALAACQGASAPQRVVSAQNTHLLASVQTPENCPSDDGGFGADFRHFGDTTPWSANPFLNPLAEQTVHTTVRPLMFARNA